MVHICVEITEFYRSLSQSMYADSNGHYSEFPGSIILILIFFPRVGSLIRGEYIAKDGYPQRYAFFSAVKPGTRGRTATYSGGRNAILKLIFLHGCITNLIF